jgi:hypothetical protein
MSEFQFPCPACGQTVSCDPALAGAETNCPLCQAHIIVPSDAAVPPPIAPVGNSFPPEHPAVLAAGSKTGAPKTSGLAIASLVCSLLSLVTCIGWLPGIICGHLARSRIRRNPSLKGGGLAAAGLLIGYLLLLSELGYGGYYLWRASVAMKQGVAQIQHNLATNNFVIVQNQSTTVSSNSTPAEPQASPATAASTNSPGNGVAADLSADLHDIQIPSHPVSGRLRDTDFVLKSATFRNGDLKLTTPNGLALDIYRLGDSIEGQNYEVQTTDDSSVNPRVKITWSEDNAEMTATYGTDYAMKLQLGQASNRRVAGKIYLRLPDKAGSSVAGTFEVRLLRARNGTGD